MKQKIRRKKIKNLKSLEEIPEFKSEEEESEFWDTHSAVDLIEKGLLEEVKLEITGSLKKKLEEHKRKQLISLRLNPEQVEKAKEIAIQKGIGYLTLMRNWIHEGIDRELNSRDKIESSIQPLIEQVVNVVLKELENKSQHLFPKLHHLQTNLSFDRIIDSSHRDATLMQRKSAPPFKLPFENLLGMPNERVMRQDLH